MLNVSDYDFAHQTHRIREQFVVLILEFLGCKS